MKKISIALIALITVAIFGSTCFAQVRVQGYTKKNGTYVAPHWRSSPNNTDRDNYSTKGNINPFTGREGTKNPTPGISVPRSGHIVSDHEAWQKRGGRPPSYPNGLNGLKKNRSNRSYLGR